MLIAKEGAKALQKAVRVVQKVLGGVLVDEFPQRKNVPLSRVYDVGVRMVCVCGRHYGLAAECPRCQVERSAGMLSW